MKKIYVFGSFIMDHTTKCDHSPKDGESIFGTSFNVSYGGKGINQAMMIKRLDGDILMIGALGKDKYGSDFKSLLKANELDNIIFEKDTSTGVSNIIIDKNGQNRIIVIAGANEELSVNDIKSIKDKIKNDSIFLIQNEIPMETIEYIIKLGKKLNAIVVLNPAPFKKIKPDILNMVDYITPNENEACDLFNLAEYNEENILNSFNKYKNIKGLILTLGDKGALYYDHKDIFKINPYKVNVVDTVGAGDAFNGGLVYGLSNEYDIKKCLNLANVCGALTITKNGALLSQPSKEDVINFLNNN